MVERRKQVRLALAASTDQNDWLAATWADRLYAREHVCGRVRDVEERGSINLRRASIVVVREFDRRPFETAALNSSRSVSPSIAVIRFVSSWSGQRGSRFSGRPTSDR